MNTKQNKGDILAARIEATLKKTSFTTHDIREALAEYRKPWTLGPTVNGFTLGPGQQWRWASYWKEEDLPEGFRPLLEGERETMGDERFAFETWTKSGITETKPENMKVRRRTRRPLPAVEKWAVEKWAEEKAALARGEAIQVRHKNSVWTDFYSSNKPDFASETWEWRVKPAPVLTPEQIAEGWVEWHGGECPVWGGSKPKVMLRSGSICHSMLAQSWTWADRKSTGDIIAYLPDPYEALKKAHAEGKIIEWRLAVSNDAFGACEYEQNLWLMDFEYRVKPEPVMVQLGPEDVLPGSAIRLAKHENRLPGHIVMDPETEINEALDQTK